MSSNLTARQERARAPWLIYLDGTILTVRGATARELPGVALMHGRCSAKSLLDRYRAGGRQPAVAILEQHVREPLSFVVTTETGRVVALARVARDTDHSFGSADIGILVEDGWQRMGIGRRLLRHCAAAAATTGYRQLVAHPGTIAAVAQRMMAAVGTTRVVSDPERHLHTSLPDSARVGLGSLHQVTLAGAGEATGT